MTWVEFSQSVSGLLVALASLIGAIAALLNAFTGPGRGHTRARSSQNQPRATMRIGLRTLVVVVLIIITGAIIAERLRPMITITAPRSGSLAFTSKPEGGFFPVTGKVSGITNAAAMRVFVLVHPVQPDGDGWFVQPPQTIPGDGSFRLTAQVGNDRYPPHPGDQIEIRAVVAAASAASDGQRVNDPANLSPVASSPTVAATLR
jgi:hypothetical protein